MRTPASYARTVLLLLPTLVLANQASKTVEERAMLEIQKGDFQSACVLLKQEVRRDPKKVELWNLLGIAETESGHLSAAAKAFETGLAVTPDSVSLNENIGFLFYREREYKSAKKYLQRAVELGSEKAGVRFSLAASRLRTGEEKEALTELDSLESSLKDVPDYWEERGRAELDVNPAQAEVSFGHALALKENSLAALNGGAAAAEKQGLDEKALTYLIRARQAGPADVTTLAHFGEVCIRRDLGPDAYDALTRARQIAPSNNLVLYLLARTNVSLQNWQPAYDLFNELATRVPTFAPAYYAMGWLAAKLNRAKDERLQLQHAVSLDPALTGAMVELAKLDLNEADINSAEKLLEEALQREPSHAEANMMMGDIMTRRGNTEAAQSFLEKAVQQNPKLAAAHYKLAMLYFRTHDSERAEREKNIASALNSEADRMNKTQLRLVLPDGNVLR